MGVMRLEQQKEKGRHTRYNIQHTMCNENLWKHNETKYGWKSTFILNLGTMTYVFLKYLATKIYIFTESGEMSAVLCHRPGPGNRVDWRLLVKDRIKK